MVYESDFYTTRRPYRYTPSYSTYTVSSVPSRQVRILPGLGKVHIVHTYDRIVPYVGHKRLTVVTTPPKVYSTRPSILQREYDWIENKLRPWVSYSATNNYLNSNSAVRIVYNRYPGLWNDSHSSSSLYRKYGTKDYYSSSNWPYYISNGIWKYMPYRYFSSYLTSTPLTRSIYWNDWLDKPIDWYYSYWPYYNRYSSYYDFMPSTWTYNNWYWSTYTPRRMVYYRSPLVGIQYPSYQPITYYAKYNQIYRPLHTYDYYWPYSSLNYLTNWWPRYRYHFDEDLSYRSLRLQRIFDDETRLIRAQTASLMKSVHLPVPRQRSYPITALNRYGNYPARLSNDHYIHKLMQISPKNSKVEFVTYFSEPVKKYFGQGHLACVYYVGDRGVHGRRRNVYVYEDPVRNDIQLLSFYINKFKEEKQQKQAIEPSKATLSPIRPSRKFNKIKQFSDEIPQEIKELREARAARLAQINAPDSPSVENVLRVKKQQEEARLAEEKAIAEEQAIKEAKERTEAAKESARKAAEDAEKEAAKKLAEEAAREAAEKELAEQIAREAAEREQAARETAKRAAEKAAELERQAELLRQEEIAKQAEIEKAQKEEEERLRAEEEKRLAEEAKLEEEKRQLQRLEEIAKQAEEEREAELARQAEELAELARQEAELAEQARIEEEAAQLVRQQEELAEIEKQKQELEELEKREQLLTEEASKAKEEAEIASKSADDIHQLEIDTEEEKEAELIQDTDQIEVLNDVQSSENIVEPDEEDEAVEDEEEPIAEAEDNPADQEDTADEADEE